MIGLRWSSAQRAADLQDAGGGRRNPGRRGRAPATARPVERCSGPAPSRSSRRAMRCEDENTRKAFLAGYDAQAQRPDQGRRQAGHSADRAGRLSVLDSDRRRKATPGRSTPRPAARRFSARRIGRNELAAIQAVPRLRRCAERIRRHDAEGRRAGGLRPAHRQQPGQEGRPVLAGRGGRAAKPARRGGRATRPARLPRRQRRAVSRLLLQDPDPAGRQGAGRRARLHRRRQDDRRLRAGRLAGRIRQLRHHDLHGQPRRRRVREGSRRGDRQDRRRRRRVQSGRELEEGQSLAEIATLE